MSEIFGLASMITVIASSIKEIVITVLIITATLSGVEYAVTKGKRLSRFNLIRLLGWGHEDKPE